MIRLVAIDIDGTLLTDEKSISNNTKKTLLNARKNGVKIVLTTGRPFEGLTATLNTLEFNTNDKDVDGVTIQDYVVCFNGALVKNLYTNDIITDITLQGNHLQEIYQLSQQLGTNIHAFSATQGLIAPKISKYTQLEMDINNISIQLVDFQNIDASEKIVKVMLIDEPHIIDSAVRNLADQLYDKYTIVRSTPYFLEFLNKEANKGLGLKMLAEYLGIFPGEIMSFGDAGNDLHMIKYAGLGVAMDNATDEIKAAAQFVADSNNNDGVAKTLQQFSIDRIKLLRKC